jgi:hypothetical protein
MSTLLEVLETIADGEHTSPVVSEGVKVAMTMGFDIHAAASLSVGDQVCYITTDVFGFGPEPGAKVQVARITKIEPIPRYDGMLMISHAGGETDIYEYEYVLSKLSLV